MSDRSESREEVDLEEIARNVDRIDGLDRQDLSSLFRDLLDFAREQETGRREMFAACQEYRDQLDHVRHELFHLRFDRDCLKAENDQLGARLERFGILFEEDSEDIQMQAAKKQLDNAARCLDDVDEFLIDRLESCGVARNRRIDAIRFVRQETDWPVDVCKQWVNEYYYDRP